MILRDFDRILANYHFLLNYCRQLTKSEAATKAEMMKIEASSSQTVGLIVKVNKTEKVEQMNNLLVEISQNRETMRKGLPYIAELIVKHSIPTLEIIRDTKFTTMLTEFAKNSISYNQAELNFYNAILKVSKKTIFSTKIKESHAEEFSNKEAIS